MRAVSRFTSPLALVTLLGVLALAACGGAQASSSPVKVEAATLAQDIETGTAPLIVDVRTADEFAAGHVPGAINIPYDQMEARSAEIVTYKDQAVVLYCRSGRRSGIAAETLAGKGFTNLGLLQGDMPGWESAGFPVER